MVEGNNAINPLCLVLKVVTLSTEVLGEFLNCCSYSLVCQHKVTPALAGLMLPFSQ